LIDLDGALEGRLIYRNIIQNIAKINNIKIQVGGGVRSLEQIDQLINAGVDKIILGTKAVEDLNFLKNACEKFKGRIALAIDVRNGFIALSGWKKQTDILASDFIKKIDGLDISRIIYTDIDKDGTKLGPNIQGTLNFSNLTQIPIVVSGGISSIQDVINIKEKKSKKIEGIIVGKAIYDESIDLKKLSRIT
jgi:Phosphoribosylformimino-5-aminoimidazole carboxamide ribonucleotide (ProFAR) isomerase